MTLVEETPALPPEWMWRCSLQQYHEMIQAGILTENDRVELLNGWLVRKMTEKPAHTAAAEATYEAIRRVLPPGWYVRSPHPITLPASEPEPDAAVAQGDRRRYTQRHPGPADLALVVEVADATLHSDQTLKKLLYAEAGIAVYWIVNLVDRRVDVYTEPSGPSERPDYRQRKDYASGEELPLVVEGIALSEKTAVGDRESPRILTLDFNNGPFSTPLCPDVLRDAAPTSRIPEEFACRASQRVPFFSESAGGERSGAYCGGRASRVMQVGAKRGPQGPRGGLRQCTTVPREVH